MSASSPSRRRFLHTTTVGAGLAAAGLGPVVWGADDAPSSSQQRPRVAAIFTAMFFRSHTYNILESFLGPYYFNGQLTDPGVDVVALYADQFPGDDMAREVSQRFGIPLFPSIREAVCVGGRELAVDAVLSIGEHGDYPYNDRGQQLYPRKRFFDEAVAVMQQSGRFVPFFNDKHLSYRWDWSREMFDTARQNGIALMAGSSVPLAQRCPMIELSKGADIEEAVSIHGGGLESYDFHGLEVLQSFVEHRRGGETGIKEIQLLTGEAFEQAKKEGRWSQGLVDSAMKCESDMQAHRQPQPSRDAWATREKLSQKKHQKSPRQPVGDYAIRVSYTSGLKATVLKVGSTGHRWNFACRLRGESAPRATALFNGPWGNRCLFKALSHAIQHLFKTGQEPYPAERTLLTTGAVDAVMSSWQQDGATIETPHLNIAYQPNNWTSFRENGASWSIITADDPQPTKFEPLSWDALHDPKSSRQ